MLSAYQLCFAVFLAALYHTQLGESSSHFNNTEELTGGEGFSNSASCGWNCKVIESHLPKQSDSLFSKTSLIHELVVNYETTVDKKCVKQTSRSSSGIATEYYEVWPPTTNKLSSFANGIKNVSEMIFRIRHQGDIKSFCNFKPARTMAPSPTDVRVELQKSIEEMYNITITKKEQRSWSESPLQFLFWVSFNAFIYYSPAFLCLFCPTVVMENGVRYIAIKGASPVSFRGVIGNNLFSKDCTTWRGKVEMLILRIVVLPLPLLAPAIIAVYYLPFLKVLGLNFTHPFIITCFACFFIRAVYESYILFSDVSYEAKPCKLCLRLKSNLACVDVLPRRILSHLRIQPFVLVECWRVFIRSLVRYFKTIMFYSLKCSTVWVLRIPLFIIFVSTVPAATIILLAYRLICLCLSLLHTLPLFTMFYDYEHVTEQTENYSSVFDCLLDCVKVIVGCFCDFCVTMLSIAGSAAILSLVAYGVLFTLLLALTIVLLFPEESLPFVACFVLVFYYLFSSYSSFTDKYHDLSVTLFKCYKTSREELCTEPVQEVTPNSGNKGNMTIPKEFFDMACEELMPIREGVCILVLKVTSILCFVFFVFLLTMRLDVGATPLTKALVTLATGTFPKIIAIYFDGERQRNLQAMIIEDKAPKILQDYLNRTHRANQEDNCGAITDEVIFNHGTEENIELLNTGYGMVSETDETPV